MCSNESNDDLVSRKSLYDKFAKLEADAIKKLQDPYIWNDKLRFAVWSAILSERSAYKYDIMDEPAAV